jgi:hypothetical protein
VKKDVREWLETFIGGGSPFEADVRHILDNNDALRAEVRDLKARLKAARAVVTHRWPVDMDEAWDAALFRYTDLRVKNWRAR